MWGVAESPPTNNCTADWSGCTAACRCWLHPLCFLLTEQLWPQGFSPVSNTHQCLFVFPCLGCACCTFRLHASKGSALPSVDSFSTAQLLTPAGPLIQLAVGPDLAQATQTRRLGTCFYRLAYFPAHVRVSPPPRAGFEPQASFCEANPSSQFMHYCAVFADDQDHITHCN